MFNTIKNLFGFGPSTDYPELLKQGAAIVDVRTKGEYQQGHIKGSINIPLHELTAKHSKLDKSKPVIACCASGVRSSQAKTILKANGFSDVYNGGGWQSLKSKI